MQKTLLLVGGVALLILLVAAGVFVITRPGPVAPQPLSPSPTGVIIAAKPTATSAITAVPATASPSVTGPVAVPTAAGGLQATPGDTVISLSWQQTPNTTGYFVFRDNANTPLNSRPLTETRYVDIGLSNGRSYTYTLTIADGTQPGQRIAEISAAPTSH